MSRPNRYARKTDGPHAAVGAIFRQLCPAVEDTHAAAFFVDYVIKTARGSVFLVEVKVDHRPSRMLPKQKAMGYLWGSSYRIVTNEDEARELALH